MNKIETICNYQCSNYLENHDEYENIIQSTAVDNQTKINLIKISLDLKT